MHIKSGIYFILLFCLVFRAAGSVAAPLIPKGTASEKELKLLRDSLKHDLKEARINSNDKTSPNFTAARNSLAHAFKNPYGKNNPEVYLQAANTEYLCFQTERNKPASGGKMDEKIIYVSTAAGFQYYAKAYRMYRDPKIAKSVSQPSAKAFQQMRSNAYELYRSTQGFRATAGYYFKQKDWKSAYSYFKLASESLDCDMLTDYANSNPAMKADFEKFRIDSIRQQLIYSCAVTAVLLEDHPLAVKELEAARFTGIEPNRVRQQLCKEYLALHDTVGYERSLRDGVAVLPTEPWFAENLLNLYLAQNDHQQALSVIDLVIKNAPDNAHNIELKGQLLDETGQTEDAEGVYKLAILHDSTLLVSYSALGRIYFNRAIELENHMIEARQFDRIYEVVVPRYELALPYYEKAYQNDKERKDSSIAAAIRTILYKRFQSPKCKNAKALIRRYNEVSRAYGMTEL